MDEIARLLLLFGLAGVMLTLLASAGVWLNRENRRIRRALRRVLGAEPHALLIADGRGRGVGFNFTRSILSVTWDRGAWCLVYRIDELIGAELVVDGEVTARTHRGEPRRALDVLTGADELVRLRLVFDDPVYPDFDLDLWRPQDQARRSSAEAVQEANRWIARTEALLRRPVVRRDPPFLALAPGPEPDSEPKTRPAVRPDGASLPPWEDPDGEPAT